MLISIVVPIYNVSKYIEQGIHQLLALTYKEIEIFLVDDGSTDGSSNKVDYWASRYNFITAIHQENAGAGSARQNGIDHAKGDYIWFFDIDDKIESDLIEKCLPYLRDNLDILQFSYDTFDPDLNIFHKCSFNPKVMNSNIEVRNNFVDHLLGLQYLNGFVWNKIYRTDFLRKYKIKFQNQKIQQDEVFNLLAYKKVNKIQIISDILYHYFIYHKGNTGSFYIPNRINIFQEVRDNFLDLYNYWELDDKRMLQYVYGRHIDSVINTLNFNLNCSFRSGLEDIKHVLNDTAIQQSLLSLNQLNCETKSLCKKGFRQALKRKSIVQYVILFCFIKFLEFFKL